MSFIKSKTFKYIKNLIIGVGASVVMLGALYKIMSWEGGDTMITAGLVTEAFLFLMLGLIPPDKDYYWEKLYPGLDDYNSNISSITAGETSAKPLDGKVVENQLGGMLTELQTMSKSLGSLKALQEVDFSKTKNQLKSMSDYYAKMNAAMEDLSATAEDTKKYREQMSSLNKNVSSLNGVYDGVLKTMNENADQMNSAVEGMAASASEVKSYKDQMSSLNKNLNSLNSVYGNMLSAMSVKS
jgi:gliding motility-associated protein GldL